MVNADPLIELVGFLHDKNPQVRAVAAQELVPYSTRGHAKISIFKSDGFRAITDLKILILDEPKTAHDSLTILINLSQDPLIRAKLVDEVFLSMILATIINKENGLADLSCMLLCNLAKSDAITSLISMTRAQPTSTASSPDEGPTDPRVLNQLLDVYVKGSNKAWNPHANYDFLTNLFSDLTRFPEARRFLLTVQAYDGLRPLSKIIVFTDSSSQIRRTGVASIVKNCCFETARHGDLLREGDDDGGGEEEEDGEAGINVLVYLLGPLCGPETDESFSDAERDGMFESLQFLPDDKRREADPFTITVLLDALLLLCSSRAGRQHLRRRQTYPIVRQLHLAHGENEEIGECCDKLVNMLMRDEDPDMPDLDPTQLPDLKEDEEEEEEEEESSDEELQITEV